MFFALADLTVVSNLRSIYVMPFYLAFSEESPCYEENMDWEIITDNYFDFLSNLLKSPAASVAR